MTRTTGSFAVALLGRTRYPFMLPLPRGDGTVADSAAMRPSCSGTCTACVVRPEHVEQGGCCYPANGKILRAVEKCAAADCAMHILVKQIQKGLGEIGRFLSFHVFVPHAVW